MPGPYRKSWKIGFWGKPVSELKKMRHDLRIKELKLNYHMQYMGGQIFYLANLKSILEGGIDL